MLDFERLRPGYLLGSQIQSMDPSMLRDLARIYGVEEEVDAKLTVSPALVTVVLMRAYTQLSQGRPDGNVHVGQRYEISRWPRFGENVAISLWCESKRYHKERRIVTFKSVMKSPPASESIVVGYSTLFWAS